jgi:hypothetical protein
MDALNPFVAQLQLAASEGLDTANAVRMAVEAAQKGCSSTAHMESHFSCSTYVGAGGTELGTQAIPDPGACGIVAIGSGITSTLRESKI